MSIEEEIEEMARDTVGGCGICRDCLISSNCGVLKIATRLHKEGYRKQSEGEWKSGKTVNGVWGYSCSICSAAFVGENAEWIAKEHHYCPKCGAKMKGGAE